jgi:hypothetical protein
LAGFISLLFSAFRLNPGHFQIFLAALMLKLGPKMAVSDVRTRTNLKKKKQQNFDILETLSGATWDVTVLPVRV